MAEITASLFSTENISKLAQFIVALVVGGFIAGQVNARLPNDNMQQCIDRIEQVETRMRTSELSQAEISTDLKNIYRSLDRIERGINGNPKN